MASVAVERRALDWYQRQASVRTRADLFNGVPPPYPDNLARGLLTPIDQTPFLPRGRRDAKPKRQAFPAAIEARYMRMLRVRQRANHRFTMEAIRAELERVGPSINARARLDSAADDRKRLLQVIARVEKRASSAVPITEEDLIRLGEQLALFTDKAVDKQLQTVVAIDITEAAGTSLELVQAWVAENVDLITSLEGNYFAELRDAVITTVRDGGSTKDLISAISERYDVSQSRAELIAVDQVGKLNGQATMARQTALGIEKFKWSTSKDERVRPLHQTLEGKIFTWADGHPTEGFPGQPIRCRCSAIPVLE